MGRIFQDNEVTEVPTGVKTLGDAELVVVPTSDGNYKIVAKGAKTPAEFIDNTFTNLIHAKRAVAYYLQKNLSKFNKKANMQAAIERRQRAYELKNGELKSTVNGGVDVDKSSNQ